MIATLLGNRNEIDFSKYSDELKILYENASKESNLPKTLTELVDSNFVFHWVI